MKVQSILYQLTACKKSLSSSIEPLTSKKSSMTVVRTPQSAHTILASEYSGSNNVAAIEKKHSVGF